MEKEIKIVKELGLGSFFRRLAKDSDTYMILNPFSSWIDSERDEKILTISLRDATLNKFYKHQRVEVIENPFKRSNYQF